MECRGTRVLGESRAGAARRAGRARRRGAAHRGARLRRFVPGRLQRHRRRPAAQPPRRNRHQPILNGRRSIVASVLGQNPYVERRTGERRRLSAAVLTKEGLDGLRVSWGGVWGGVLVTLGSLMLLSALGVAVGMTALDPTKADTSRLAVVATIWGAASFLASLF